MLCVAPASEILGKRRWLAAVSGLASSLLSACTISDVGHRRSAASISFSASLVLCARGRWCLRILEVGHEHNQGTPTAYVTQRSCGGTSSRMCAPEEVHDVCANHTKLAPYFGRFYRFLPFCRRPFSALLASYERLVWHTRDGATRDAMSSPWRL